MSGSIRLTLAAMVVALGFAAAAYLPATPRDATSHPSIERVAAAEQTPATGTRAFPAVKQPANRTAFDATGRESAPGRSQPAVAAAPLTGSFASPPAPLRGPDGAAVGLEMPRANALPVAESLSALPRGRRPAAASASLSGDYDPANASEMVGYDDTTDDRDDEAADEVVGAVATGPRVHEVRDGDTLVDLAERYLGDGQRYLEIYEENRHLLPSPDVLPIGVRLNIPADAPRIDGPPALPSGLLTPLRRKAGGSDAR